MFISGDWIITTLPKNLVVKSFFLNQLLNPTAVIGDLMLAVIDEDTGAEVTENFTIEGNLLPSKESDKPGLHLIFRGDKNAIIFVGSFVDKDTATGTFSGYLQGNATITRARN